VLATGPGHLEVVPVGNTETVRCSHRPVQKSDLQLLDGPHVYLCPSARWFCPGLLVPSVPITGSGFWVFLFMIALRYPTVYRKILTLVRHYLFLMYWLPF